MNGRRKTILSISNILFPYNVNRLVYRKTVGISLDFVTPRRPPLFFSLTYIYIPTVSLPSKGQSCFLVPPAESAACQCFQLPTPFPWPPRISEGHLLCCCSSTLSATTHLRDFTLTFNLKANGSSNFSVH